ncbi:MAG: arylsulfatase [Candidatus Dechloromonas phosphoritropha]|jgi:arylsulfatase|nr:arylsulfatase [Azonexus sp.]
MAGLAVAAVFFVGGCDKKEEPKAVAGVAVSAVAAPAPKAESAAVPVQTSEVAAAPAQTPGMAAAPAQQSGKKPNIMFIMGDDIGIMNVGAYHQGLMVGETPNIDRLAKEGARFMTAYAEQSCTAGRTSFATGMNPLRAGMIMPQLPGSTSSLLPGTPHIAKFLLDLGYNTGEFGKNHLGDKPGSLPTAHGVQEFWGYLYHLDAMQGVSFPDINKTPTDQAVVPPCKNLPVKGLAEVPGAVDPKTTLCMMPPRPVIWCHSKDGTEANQSCTDEGPLPLERSKIVDEEISAKVIDYLDRNDPKKTGKPFFVWYNPARMHITTVFSPKYEAMLGVKGGKDWGINEVGMKQMDDNIGEVFKKLEAMGEMDNTIIVFTTDNGAEVITYPDGGVTPFRGGKLTTWEGGMRVPLLIRWPGHIQPGILKDQIFSMLDFVPTFVDIAGGAKGDDLNKQIMAGKYPGILKTKLDGVNQRAYLEGKGDSARDTLFYYSGTHPSAVRYKNWKMYYAMAPSTPLGGLLGVQSWHWTQVNNIKRDPFEGSVMNQNTFSGISGALAAPSTAYIYDWNLLPIGQLLWMKELMSYKEFPALQSPSSYNLDQIIKEMQEANTSSHAGE